MFGRRSQRDFEDEMIGAAHAARNPALRVASPVSHNRVRARCTEARSAGTPRSARTRCASSTVHACRSPSNAATASRT